jgi:hypothetical protein
MISGKQGMNFTRIVSCAAVALCALVLLGGCCSLPNKWKRSFDPPMNYEGRETICLHNLEKLLDAKQEWARDNMAGPRVLCPSAESLAHKYFRKYEYGRRAPWDEDTRNLPIARAICPSGGEYVIGTIGERPKCSLHGDLLRDYDQHIRVPYTH